MCSDTNAYDFNLDQGFIANAMAPANTLGKTTTATGALIGTYCTTNNIGTGGLSQVDSTYTGDFITIAGKLFFKNSYNSIPHPRLDWPLLSGINIYSIFRGTVYETLSNKHSFNFYLYK